MAADGDLNLGPNKAPLITASLAERFHRRATELARSGLLGSLRTRKASLQVSYGHLASLLDNPSIPILICGEKGSGKRRLVDEYLILHNFYRKLEGMPLGHLKVYRGDFVKEGFTQQLLTPRAHTADLIYIEDVDALSLSCQKELLEHLQQREIFASTGVIMPRLFVGTVEALSMKVIRKEFSRDLFQAITAFGIFLPTLNERSEDVPELIQALTKEITGKIANPPRWFVDFVSRQLWAENLDDLKRLLKNGLMKKANLSDWTEEDLPAEFRIHSMTFVRARPEDRTEIEKDRLKIKRLLIQSGGNRHQAASLSGLSTAEFLKKLFRLGLR